ncbi:glycosyltransferase [Clostridium sp.]|uniref:glycosyltransferase n=1 Tax=Clostridium sp. TaxID=1506 RepID=UPI002909D7C3|nr:glycosyltransferase [Clostridium sp.]MDU5107127.1 glycosyltransferase [Clostridium sp.]
MKILILASWYPDDEKPLNGVFFKEQAEALKQSGVDVCVLNIHLDSIPNLFKKNKSIGFKKSNENNINVYRYKSYNFFPKMYKNYIRFYSYLLKKYIKKIEDEEGKIDLVHIHSAFDAGIAYSVSNINIPYIITEHSSRYDRGVINKSEENMLYGTFTKAKKVIAVGSGLAKKIQKYCDNNTPLIVPNMVKVVNCDNISIDKKKNKFRFFSLAFLNEYKGMDILIKAFSKNRDLMDSIELFIGGNGPEKSKLENLTKKLGLEDKITFLGELSREEVNYNIKNSDAFILASRVETFGVVFIEAMAQGKPVIGTKTGGPDTFINDNVGLKVDINDVDGVAKAIKFMYENYNKYDKDCIKKYCIDNFSEKNIVDKLKSIYKEVLGDRNV